MQEQIQKEKLTEEKSKPVEKPTEVITPAKPVQEKTPAAVKEEAVKKPEKTEVKTAGEKGKKETGGKPATAKEKVKAKVEKPEEKKVEIVLERKYVIPLYDAYAKPAKKRAAKAIKIIRKFASRHMKTPEANVRIDNRLAHFVNARGSKYPPKKLSVKLQKTKEGTVTAVPA